MEPFSIHDIAGIFLRYLKSLPEPVIPFKHYTTFIIHISPHVSGEPNEDQATSLNSAMSAIKELGSSERALLLYVLDIIDITSSHEHNNSMSLPRLVSVFQPLILSAPPEQMDSVVYETAAAVVASLSEHTGVADLIAETAQADS